MNFVSDNVVGASAPVLEALVRANGGALPAYGNDEITKRVEATFAQIFETEVAVFPVTTGTAANAPFARRCGSAVGPLRLSPRIACHRR